jgi:protein gp37
MAKRMAKNPKIASEIKAAYAGNVPPLLVEERLHQPTNRKSPSVVGVQLMGDLFLNSVSNSQVIEVFGAMHDAPWHTYVILTKHPRRMMEMVNSFTHVYENVALGVTAENEKWARERIPWLIRTRGGYHFVSYEPALSDAEFKWYSPMVGHTNPPEISNLDGIIAGCESGPRRRPSNPDWFRSVRDQCQKSGTSFFLKQMDIDGKVVEMPELDGQVWDQLPWRQNEKEGS